MKKIVYALLLISIAIPLVSCEKSMEKLIKKGLDRQKLEMLEDKKLHVVLIGTGGPMNNAKRTSTCTAIVAGGTFLLFDIGPGTWRNVDLMNLPMGHLNAVLLTHFHSDHIGDLGEANFGSWVAGRTQPLEIYGPSGVEQVVQGFEDAYRLDTTYRLAHHGDSVLVPQAAQPVSKTIIIEDVHAKKIVFERNGLKVYAFLVDHYPVAPAFGYRIEYKGNVVVISGDTKKTANVITHSAQADLLITNALSFKLMRMVSKVAMENNRHRIAKISKDVMDYQLDPIQAAEIARDAGAKTLVLSHIVPPVTNFIIKRFFIKGIGKVYDGEVIMGEDGMDFTFAPKGH